MSMAHGIYVGQDEDMAEMARRLREKTTLPEDSAARKEIPIAEGVVKYFPAALAAVAKVSKFGNDKHNGKDTPLHHSRGKSMDHADCIIRHMMDMVERPVDKDGIPEVAYLAWRALALCQEWCEQNEGAPLAPNATVES
jgi:hypothetical protein